MRPCWTRAPTCARWQRCTGCYAPAARPTAGRTAAGTPTHPATVKPELVATQWNHVWSWDITKLRGQAKWTLYHYLYVILDIDSRYVVGSLIASRESKILAERLFAETIRKQGITRDQLTIQADRGSSMMSKRVAFRWPTSESPSPTAARTRPTTTRTARASSGPRSTGPTSPTSSPRSGNPGSSAASSSVVQP